MKTITMLGLPLAAFLGGIRVMQKISNRDYVTQRLRQSAAPEDQKPLQERLGYDADAVNRHWGALDNTALRLERRFLALDLAFPFLYGATLSASSLRAWATLARPFRPAWLMAPVAVTVLADWTENLVQLGQLRRYTEEDEEEAGLQPGWIRIASAATILKMLSFVGASLLLVGLVLSVIVSSCARTGIVEPPRHRTRRSTVLLRR